MKLATISFLVSFALSILQAQEINLEWKLISHYPMNGNAFDSSGNEQHGQLDGPLPAIDRDGISGAALQFDGIDDYITLPQDFDFPERTICFWFNAVNIPEWNYSNDPDHSLSILYTFCESEIPS